MCECSVTPLLTYSNVNFSGVIWHCATAIHSTAWLFRVGYIRMYQFTLHHIKNKHHCNWSLFPALMLRINTSPPLQLKSISSSHASYEHRLTTATEVYFRRSRFVWTPPSCVVPLAGVYVFVGSRASAKPAFYRYRRGKLVIPEQFTVKTHPISVGWRRESTMRHTIIPVCSWHRHSKHAQNTQKHIKSWNYLSLLRFSLLLPNCEGSHSAFIYKFQYACTHERPISLEHVRGGGVSFVMAALLSERYETVSN